MQRFHVLLVSCVVIALSACQHPTENPDEEQAPEPRPVVNEARGLQGPSPTQCLAADAVCSLVDAEDKPCCAGLRCEATSSELGACVPLLDDGASCWGNEQCAGGYCAGGLCTSTCSSVGEVCDWNGGCCDGTLCSIEIEFSYGPGVCVAPLSDGEYCWTDSHCASGNCADNACTSSPQ